MMDVVGSPWSSQQQNSAPAMARPSMAPKKAESRNLYTKIRDEARVNMAFRFTLIGAILAVFGALLSIVLTVFAEKITPLIFVLLLNLVLTTVIMALNVYTNYCYVHGKCNVFAGIHAALVFIISIFMVILPIISSLVMRGRLPRVSDAANMTMMKVSPRKSATSSSTKRG
jgi:hypothetical protein